MKQAYVFDVDGTLTPSRESISDISDPIRHAFNENKGVSFQKFFLEFCNTNDVFLVTGSDHKKTREQLGDEICNSIVRSFNCNGNSIWENGLQVYSTSWELPKDCRKFLERELLSSKFKHRTGNHIEERPGMVNFSVVGRNCDKLQREEYVQWDLSTDERKEIADRFNNLFLVTHNTEAIIGGDTGLDIGERFKDKRQVLPLLAEYDEVHFFGDKMWTGGNDFSLGSAITSLKRGQIYAVNDWEHTYYLLERIQLKSNKGVFQKSRRIKNKEIPLITRTDDKDSINRHSDAWCPIPFNAISLNPNGSLTRCMMSNTPMTEQSDYSNWDNAKFKNLRTNMLAGTWDHKGCYSCKMPERNGLESQRQKWLKNQVKKFPDGAYDNPSVTGNPIRHLFLNFGNICNFKCRMCSPNFSNALLPEFKHMQKMNVSRQYSESFAINNTSQFKNINSAIDFLDYYHDQLDDLRTIWITGGEPLLDDTLYDVCDVLTSFGRPEEISIVITTNGSKLDIDKLAELSHFKRIEIDISLDAVGDRFEYMRSNGLVTWEQISKTVLDVYEFKKDNPWLVMSLNASYQLYNADNIYDFIKFAAPISDMNLRVLTGPRYYQLAHASDSIKNEARAQIKRALKDFSSILTDRHRGRLSDINKMIDRDRNEDYWQEFVQVTNEVDEYRDMHLKDYYPKLAEEVNNTPHSIPLVHHKYLDIQTYLKQIINNNND